MASFFLYINRYNASEHPIPFHRAQDLGKIPKKLAGGPAPDLEEAYVRGFFIDLLFFHTHIQAGC